MMPQPTTVKVKRSPGALTIKVGESVDALAYLQHWQWHQLLLAGPTPNVVGARGNDLPGGYYYDPVSRQEYVVMAKGNVDWQKSAIRVEVSSLRELRFGLYSTQDLADVELEVWRGLREKPPTQWEALNTLASRSFLLLPLPDPVAQVPDWTSVALRLLETLESSAVRHELHSMSFRAPVYYSLREHSGVYGDVRQLRVELVCQASIARALHRASSERVVEDFQAISREIATKVVPLFYRSDLEMFENAYTDAALEAAGGLPDDPGVVDTWYALNNLVEVIHLCAAFPSRDSASSSNARWTDG